MKQRLLDVIYNLRQFLDEIEQALESGDWWKAFRYALLLPHEAEGMIEIIRNVLED